MKIETLRSGTAFESWMRKNHSREEEVWLCIYKKAPYLNARKLMSRSHELELRSQRIVVLHR